MHGPDRKWFHTKKKGLSTYFWPDSIAFILFYSQYLNSSGSKKYQWNDEIWDIPVQWALLKILTSSSCCTLFSLSWVEDVSWPWCATSSMPEKRRSSASQRSCWGPFLVNTHFNPLSFLVQTSLPYSEVTRFLFLEQLFITSVYLQGREAPSGWPAQLANPWQWRWYSQETELMRKKPSNQVTAVLQRTFTRVLYLNTILKCLCLTWSFLFYTSCSWTPWQFRGNLSFYLSCHFIYMKTIITCYFVD